MIPRRELTPGYSISRLVHGGWQFSAGHRLDGVALDAAIELLVESAQRGVTTFDCADIYTGVEELFGRFLRRWATTSAPAPIQVHTKLVPDWEALPTLDRAYVHGIVDRSLRRLGVERLDLVQFYWWRDDIPGMEEAAGWLAELVPAGKIRHVAATNLEADRLRRIIDAGVPLVANQVQYSVLDRRPEHGLATWADAAGVALLCYGGLAGGFLTDGWVGRSDPAEPGTRSRVKYRLVIEEFGGWDAYQALLSDLAAIAAAHSVPLAAVALRWVLDRPGVAACVVGATRPEQMAANALAFSVRLSDAERTRIRTHLDRAPGPGGDVFALERDREGPHGRIMRYDLNRSAE